MTSHPIPATLSHVILVKSHLDSFYLHFLFSRMGLVMYDGYWVVARALFLHLLGSIWVLSTPAQEMN